jgi:hypothetical protein
MCRSPATGTPTRGCRRKPSCRPHHPRPPGQARRLHRVPHAPGPSWLPFHGHLPYRSRRVHRPWGVLRRHRTPVESKDVSAFQSYSLHFFQDSFRGCAAHCDFASLSPLHCLPSNQHASLNTQLLPLFRSRFWDNLGSWALPMQNSAE